MSETYAALVEQLRSAYDGSAAARDEDAKSEWKLAERRAFRDRLRAAGKERLIEVGAGTGQDSLFFQESGFRVIATDLSSAMVARCRNKGIEAYAMDFLHLDFPAATFDAAYAFNCLLHVPNADFPLALASLGRILKPGALAFIGLYGGEPFEGVPPNDWHDPPRFFSFRSDAQIRSFVEDAQFEVLDFHIVKEDRLHFQSLTLRAPDSNARCP